MNKAFTREPEATDARCPHCGSAGTVVYHETLAAHLSPEALAQFTDSAFFCPFAGCDVVYFDLFDRVIEESAVKTPVYPKNLQAPLCACFGLTCDDVDLDIAEGVVTRTRACIEQAKSPEAHCGVASPSGQSCVTELQRYYMRRRGGEARG